MVVVLLSGSDGGVNLLLRLFPINGEALVSALRFETHTSPSSPSPFSGVLSLLVRCTPTLLVGLVCACFSCFVVIQGISGSISSEIVCLVSVKFSQWLS
ncbi:hypothetical protein V6N12_031200 [Hibiscus sabdariffa]|uniref:Uncharacterized protein n=1 Tax=Hibiscus sabdariffa TaxID=183260 RepID=A0ABR2E899_9ROSI